MKQYFPFTFPKMWFFTCKTYSILLWLLLCCQWAIGQEGGGPWIHSHNDYHQNIPFWKAFSSGLNTIEADIHLVKGTLYVAHDRNEILEDRTLETLYLEPMVTALERGFGKQAVINLMVDIKSDAVPSLNSLVQLLKRYPKIINSDRYRIIVSGSRPDANTYHSYPDFIYFDHQQLDNPMDAKDWERVAMVSLPFGAYSEWNGKGRLTHTDLDKVKETIAKAKQLKRPFRFWGTPDSKTAWRTFVELGMDVINTDRPFECASYLETLSEQKVRNQIVSDIYRPTFKNDGGNGPVRNVVLMIGDGNGLTQISAAVLANKGALTLTQLKSMGLAKTQSADDFTTDSAAAGTALSTGVKTNNRAIGTDTALRSIPNSMERLKEWNFRTGCITTDEITGATPSAFYAHRIDRSETSGIAEDLLKSELDLFMGGGSSQFVATALEDRFNIFHSLDAATAANEEERVGVFFATGGVPSVLDGRGNLLAEATKWGLQFLGSKKDPFFLMVEAAQIDSFGHANNTAGVIAETIDFDRAIAEAIAFADKDGETLVIITADHETGGFSIPSGDSSSATVEGAFFSDDHTAVMVPVFAYGPQSDKFMGVYENTAIFQKIMECLKRGK
ncbi:MAG: alkaline phosphatase [Sediminicola sp.]